MLGALGLTVTILPVLLGAALSVSITWFVASRWKNRCGISYSVASFVFYVVFFIAAFEYGILDAIRMGKTVPSDTIDTLLLGHSVITAMGVTVLTLLFFGLFVGLRPVLEGKREPMRAFTGCAAFCLILTALLNPVGGVERLRATSTSPLRMTFTAPMRLPVDEMTVKPARQGQAPTIAPLSAPMHDTAWKGSQAFPPPGLVRHVRINGRRITHFLSDKGRKRMGLDLEEYARMALAQRLYFDGGKPGPVELRDATTRHLLATRHPNGGFRWQIANKKNKRK